jgi:large subunit ribosomal protein L18
MTTLKKVTQRLARARRTHAKARISGLPRLIVRKTNTTIYAEIMDDSLGKIVCGANGLKFKETGSKAAEKVGEKIAELAKTAKIKKVSFDRNGYKYHGQIKVLADAARKAGLEF